jgi:uncharacterized membrane protein YbaN (DUF454 family)
VTKPHAPARRRSKTHNLAFAVFFFIVGVIGVLVPIMPQIPFFVMSALFLSLVFPKVRRRLRRWRLKYPKLDASYKKWRGRSRRKRQVKIRQRQETSHHEKRHPSHPSSGA